MSEEEKKQIKDFEYWVNTNNEKGVCSIPDYICNRVLNLIDKQNKELNKLKSKNKELLRKLRNRVKENNKLIKYSNYKKEFSTLNKQINKQNKVIDEMQWKPIKEYDRQKYDWVLVKYYDGDYECVPEVAEQRIDGKWYTSEKEIPFEVKYFFDMQLLDKEKKGIKI